MRPPTGRFSSEEVLGPLICVLATRTKNQRNKKKTSAATTDFRKKIRESETARWIRVVPRDQQPQQNRGTKRSPLNRGLFEPNAARYHITTTLAIFITQRTKTKKPERNNTCTVWCALLTCSFSLGANIWGARTEETINNSHAIWGNKKRKE